MSEPMPERCSCGSEMYVMRGGLAVQCKHCDGADCCRYNDSCCDKCKAYSDARPTWAEQ